ncbi:MAG TPA: hypothetical protein PLI31_05345, partial [Methanoregulaceae archaeon]|nr:hypothetical protein [Methanoregulaceae archaeon]
MQSLRDGPITSSRRQIVAVLGLSAAGVLLLTVFSLQLGINIVFQNLYYLPIVIGAVVLGAFILLVLVFRSILVPLKAALMNLISIGAAYGVVVAVFQWGWGKGAV